MEDSALRQVDSERRIQGMFGNGGLGQSIGTYSTSPIKVFTVCVEPGVGRYMAFLGSDPTKKATAGTRDQAVVDLLAAEKLIVMTEMD